MNRRRLRFALVGLAVAALLLAVIAVRFHRGVPPEDRRAEEYLREMNRGVRPAAIADGTPEEHPVPAAALVRVMVRKDSPLIRIYRQTWNVLPKWLKRHCPRPLDERTRELFVRVTLMQRPDSGQALPVLAAVLTDPRSGNREAALTLFKDLGIWVPDELVKRSLQGLQDPDPAVQLRVLESLQPTWPNQPDLRRRIAELQREAKQ